MNNAISELGSRGRPCQVKYSFYTKVMFVFVGSLRGLLYKSVRDFMHAFIFPMVCEQF